MAGKKLKNSAQVVLRKLAAAVLLLAFTVIIITGMMADVRIITITYRAFLVFLVIYFVTMVVEKLLATYEEMNSGKA